MDKNQYSPISMFLTLAFLLFFLGMLSIVEPKEPHQCESAIVADKYFDSDDNQIMVLMFESHVEKMPANDDEYYRYSVGETVTACEMRGRLSHLFGYYALEK